MDNKLTPLHRSENTPSTAVERSLVLGLSNGLNFPSLVRQKTALERKQNELELCIVRYNSAKKTMALAVEQGKKLRAELAELKAIQTIDDVDKITIGKMVAEVCLQLNVTKNMNEAQIDFLVEDIARCYPTLRTDELAFIFRQGIIGKYGKTDFRLDAQIFHEWIKAYIKEIDDRIHAQNESKMAEYEQYFDNGKYANRL